MGQKCDIKTQGDNHNQDHINNNFIILNNSIIIMIRIIVTKTKKAIIRNMIKEIKQKNKLKSKKQRKTATKLT